MEELERRLDAIDSFARVAHQKRELMETLLEIRGALSNGKAITIDEQIAINHKIDNAITKAIS